MSNYSPGKAVHVHVCKDRAKRGEPCITVTSKETNVPLYRGRGVRLVGVWDIVQYRAPQDCGASVVLETNNGEWRPL